ISQVSDGTVALSPKVTVLPNGNIAVAFQWNFDTYVHIFDSSFNTVRTDNIGTGYTPALTAFGDGSYAVSYEKSAVGGLDIAARIVSATGTVGSEFIIDNQADGQDLPQLATLSNGNFVVVYRDQFAGSATDTDILYKIFTPSGTPVSTGIPIPAVPGAFG